jgi:hypothetical protein
MNNGGGTGKSIIGEIMIDDSELFCNIFEPGGVGIGSGLSDGSGSLSVGEITLRNTTLTCDISGGVCIGIGNVTNGASQVSNVTIEGGRITSLSHYPTFSGDAIGGGLPILILDGTIVECNSIGPSCIQAQELTIFKSILGKTTTKRFFNAESISWEDGIPVRVKYLNLSEFEEITNKRLLHLREIEYLYAGPYELSVGSGEDLTIVEMDGKEDGVLMSLPLSEQGGVSHRANRSGGFVVGHVLEHDHKDIVFGTGETMVSNPRFAIATAPYLQLFNPYTARRRLLQMSIFTLALWF